MRPIPLPWPEIVLPAWERLLDFFYPPRCGGCDKRGTLFCAECRAAIVPPGEDAEQVAGVDLLVCSGVFDGPLRSAIHKLKYEGDRPLAKPLAALLAGGLQEHFSAEGVQVAIIPVPLHNSRRRQRGFNQSELLAWELSRLTGWEVGRGLERERNTRSQVGLKEAERRENMRDAFKWTGSDAPQVALLVDDVCTTGSTLSACSAALRAAGCERVCAATVARAMSKDALLTR